MLKIDGKNITLTRGDTAYIRFRPKIRVSGSPVTDYTLVSGDAVIFRLKKEDSVFEKACNIDLEKNTAILNIVPEDTIDLKYKFYEYEVELITHYQEHFTFVADALFKVGREVEEHGN